ncbi:MAG: TatD family hydrolase [Balneolales bacterium]
MIDTHAHIYLPDFSDDLQEVLERSLAAGVTDIFMPAIDFNSLLQMESLSHRHIRFHKMAGIHPCEIGRFRSDLEATLHSYSSSGRIVAIGETGLDYYWSKDHVEAQKSSLRHHCNVAKDLQKPVILHNRESTGDLLDIIEEQQDGRLSGIWHCFNGSAKEALRAIDLNLLLGIGGVVTFKNAGVDLVVKDLPLDKIVLETDAPYLAPVPKRGQRNEPSYIQFTAKKVAELHDISCNELDRISSDNARRLFGLS